MNSTQDDVEMELDHDHMPFDTPNGSGLRMEMMPMFFTFDFPAHILFGPWSPKTNGEMVGAYFAIFFMACLFEAVKRLRQYLHAVEASTVRTMSTTASTTTCCDTNSNTESIVTPRGARVVVIARSLFHRFHVLQTVLQGVQFTLGYLLMLTAMTFNVYLFMSLILGTMFGYFIFQWNSAAPSYVVLQDEHCH